MNEKLKQQLEFIIEIDKVKSIFRKTKLFDSSRYENDAEHAWHISIMAIILSEYANESSIDILKVIKMLLIHDIVEIDAGDIAVYDVQRRKENEINEKNAAKRIFGLLPIDQQNEMLSLWNEFEKRNTIEARFAAALDRIEPLMQNYLTKGYTWKKLNVSYDKIIKVNEHIKDGSEELWKHIQTILAESLENGYIAQDKKHKK